MTETAPAAPLPLPVYAVFVGELNQMTLKSIVHGLTAVSVDRAPHLHLMLQSTGGGIAEGVYLHNFIRTFPVPITVYNGGSISSAAVMVFLGARARVAHVRSTFMIHRAQTNMQVANRSRMVAASQSLKIDDVRADAILREHVKLSRKQWSQYNRDYVWLTAEQALACGIATEIGHFSPIPGGMVYDFGWAPTA